MLLKSDALMTIKINLYVRSISRIDDVWMLSACHKGTYTYYKITKTINELELRKKNNQMKNFFQDILQVCIKT